MKCPVEVKLFFFKTSAEGMQFLMSWYEIRDECTQTFDFWILTSSLKPIDWHSLCDCECPSTKYFSPTSVDGHLLMVYRFKARPCAPCSPHSSSVLCRVVNGWTDIDVWFFWFSFLGCSGNIFAASKWDRQSFRDIEMACLMIRNEILSLSLSLPPSPPSDVSRNRRLFGF